MVSPKDIYEQYNKLNAYTKQLEKRLNLSIEKQQYLRMQVERHRRDFLKLQSFTYMVTISFIIPINELLFSR
jgi:hypothetical protein